jgi:hypothetical protein
MDEIKVLEISSEGSPEKLAVSHAAKKFPVFYGTRRFITMYIRAHY